MAWFLIQVLVCILQSWCNLRTEHADWYDIACGFRNRIHAAGKKDATAHRKLATAQIEAGLTVLVQEPEIDLHLGGDMFYIEMGWK